MATLVRTMVIFEATSALPEDRSINTLHAELAGIDEEVELLAWEGALADFYTGVHAGSTQRVTGFLSNYLSGAWSFRHYDLADPEPRTPMRINSPANFTPGGNTLPQEVAFCCSYEALPVSGQQQARRRGRFYIGPLANTTSLDSNGRPGAAANGLINTAIPALQALLDASQAASGWNWVVYSPTNQDAVTVERAWVDNAFDTQRRRGNRPTAKFSVT